jgi:hypothetical protein
LAEELIDNTLDYVSTRERARALQATNELIDASPHWPHHVRKDRRRMESSQTIQSKETADGTDARKAPFGYAACARRMIQMAPILGIATPVLAKILDNASKCIVWKHTEALQWIELMFLCLFYWSSWLASVLLVVNGLEVEWWTWFFGSPAAVNSRKGLADRH